MCVYVYIYIYTHQLGRNRVITHDLYEEYRVTFGIITDDIVGVVRYAMCLCVRIVRYGVLNCLTTHNM